MGLYKNTNGVLTPIAGRGKAEYGASTVRTGTFTINENIAQGSYNYFTVTFDSPMPDADYMVYFDAGNNSGYGKLINAGSYMVFTKSTTGFQIAVAAPNGTIQSGWSISYIAYKLYTDNEYNNILASMPSNASASNKLMAKDEFVVVIANLRNESLPAGIGELYKDIPVPTGYSPFCIVDYDLGRLQGLNITGMSLAATVGQVRIATYCDRVITNELNGSIRIMCRKN